MREKGLFQLQHYLLMGTVIPNDWMSGEKWVLKLGLLGRDR